MKFSKELILTGAIVVVAVFIVSVYRSGTAESAKRDADTTQAPDTAYQRKAIEAHIRDAATCEGGEQRARELYATNSGWGYETIGAIACNKVLIGMTGDQVLLSRGRPTAIHRTTTAGGIHEQWVYEGRGEYVYLDGNIVTAIQN